MPDRTCHVASLESGALMAARLELDDFSDYQWWARNRRMLREKTIKDYVGWIRPADRWVTERVGRPLADVGHKILLAYTDTLKPSASLRNAVRCALISFFDFRIFLGERKKNPAKSLPRMKAPKKMPRPVARPYIGPLLQASWDYSPLFGTMATLYAFTGLRRDEVRLLRWSDVEHTIDPDDPKRIVMGKHVLVDQKGGDQRSVYLNEACRTALEGWWGQKPKGVWVFPSDHKPGYSISANWVWRKFSELGLDVGIQGMRLHRFRYTAAKRVLEQTGDITKVQKLLGHANLNNTMIYLEVSDSEMEEVYEGLTY